MQIKANPNNKIRQSIFNGYYSYTPDLMVPKAKLYAFSSPSFPIGDTGLFLPPFDAILKDNTSGKNTIIGVGRKQSKLEKLVNADRSGKLYFYNSAVLWGACHGFGRTDLTYYSGANFYNAFYPAGYYSPPFGENLTILKSNQDGYLNLNQGSCSKIGLTEYNELMGIVSMGATDVGAVTTSIQPYTYSPLHSPRASCPSDLTVLTYYEEVNLKLTAGTSTALGANLFYNGNPIPTSLDNYRIRFDPKQGRYQLIDIPGDKINKRIPYKDSRPIPSYKSSEQHNVLADVLCPAAVMETNTDIGRGSNGTQMIESVDIGTATSTTAPTEQVFINGGGDTEFYYWHFTFKENSDSLPFSNSATSITVNGPSRVTHRSVFQDTMLFNPMLSLEESYWQNRQCPDVVDYLPWTFGASIYACPSDHFDVPYYAATRKFGFYGTRFLSHCTKLNLTETLSGVSNATELVMANDAGITATISFANFMKEPIGLDDGGAASWAQYNSLMATAKTEERYGNMYALNKAFFLWANYPLYISGIELGKLTSGVDGFSYLFSRMINPFKQYLGNTKEDFINSGEPNIIMQAGMAGTTNLVEKGVVTDLLFTNNIYHQFLDGYKKLILNDSQRQAWTDLEDTFSTCVVRPLNNFPFSEYLKGFYPVDEDFYSGILISREKRMLTRNLENTVHGNAIDLYPLNHIPFSFDRAIDYLESPLWGRSIGASSTTLPEINRRYFEGAYGKPGDISGLLKSLNDLTNTNTLSFYPGFFNDITFGKLNPSRTFIPALSGEMKDTKGRKIICSGWLGLGYNEIGKLDKEFSCFTPIFTQHPVPKLFCKIGQHPTFHASAVDYHTIPDDKLSYRYPEIGYWANLLKLVNSKGKNLYPLKYKWLRVPKSKYTSFLSSGILKMGEYASSTGEWGCMEGDGPNCTFFRPKLCQPSGINGSDEDYYTFIHGTTAEVDDKFYYMCMASGRFGVRISEPSELNIEDWLRFDVSFRNGTNSSVGSLKIEFKVEDYNGSMKKIDFSAENIPAYGGYQFDPSALPECTVEQKMPPPNAGYGDVKAYKFVGSIGYVGATRSWAPDTLMNTRGTRGAWGRFIEYGALVPFSKKLTQSDGNLLYGYKHLPECVRWKMPKGKKGILVTAYIDGCSISHWTLNQRAVAAMDSRVGMRWFKMGHAGQLYPPISVPKISPAIGGFTWGAPGSDPLIGVMGVGHWQWGNNLGAIKRFGKLSNAKTKDIVFEGAGAPRAGNADYDALIEKVKDKFIQQTVLGGINCGWTPYGLGRNMLYYIESFGRFYELCDLMKKKNVTNISFMCPGLRHTNSAIQYFWLGQPNNTSLERRPMFGPYAHQWRVRRHNRDRNGNGMSEGFYSMGWDSKFSLLYDAPAIFGLYVKTFASNEYAKKVRAVYKAAQKLFPDGINYPVIKTKWFGSLGEEGGGPNTYKMYGSYNCRSSGPQDDPVCEYMAAALELGGSPDFSAYSCPSHRLLKGECFDPCVSIRYGQGFFPGGKHQNLFNYSNPAAPNATVKLVAMANIENNNIITTDEQSSTDKNVFFRAPVNTPHALVSRQIAINGPTTVLPFHKENIAGISPCKDGGSDHCNYITPTIHLNGTSTLLKYETSFLAAQNYAANQFSSYNTFVD